MELENKIENIKIHQSPNYTTRKTCRICDSNDLKPFLNFGKMPLAGGFIKKEDLTKDKLYPLTVVFCQRCKETQILETVSESRSLLLLGIPTRGVQLSKVLAKELEIKTGHQISQGSLDPTFHRDDLGRIGVRMAQPTDLPTTVEGRQVLLVDDVIFTGRTIRAALEALQTWGRAERVMLLAMVDRGHREVPIQPDFCGRLVPTSKDESIALRLNEIDGEEGIFLRKKLRNFFTSKIFYVKFFFT